LPATYDERVSGKVAEDTAADTEHWWASPLWPAARNGAFLTRGLMMLDGYGHAFWMLVMMIGAVLTALFVNLSY